MIILAKKGRALAFSADHSRANFRAEMMEEARALPEIPEGNAMDFYGGRYFVINMHMLRFTGLWPYQNKVAKFIIRVIFSSLIFVPAIPHIISAHVHKDNAEILIQSIGTVMYFVSLGAKYFCMLISEKKMKLLYKNMVENWQMLENEVERNIIKESGEMGRLLTMGYLGYMIGVVQVFVSLPLLPGMVNKLFPSISFLNDTKGRMLVLDGEYLVDKQKYYHQIYLFETITCIMTVPIFSTIDSTYAVCVEQCVGLLKVVKLRLEVATKNNTTFNPVSHRTVEVAREAIVKTTESHEKVLNFGKILELSYSTAFLCVMLASTSTLITTSVCILFNLHRPLFLLRFLFILTGFFIHVFFLSWPGQKMIDNSSAVFYATYNNEWYECSIESQKLLKFIMRRTLKPMYITAGGFHAMNFENFAKIMKSALSYITVLGSFA